VNKKGIEIIAASVFEYVGDFREGFARVEQNGKYGYIKSPLSTAERIAIIKQHGRLAGTIREIKSGEVIIAGTDIANIVFIGDLLVVDSPQSEIVLRANFPMMTLVRCSLMSGNIKDLHGGMSVYKKPVYEKKKEER